MHHLQHRFASGGDQCARRRGITPSSGRLHTPHLGNLAYEVEDFPRQAVDAVPQIGDCFPVAGSKRSSMNKPLLPVGFDGSTERLALVTARMSELQFCHYGPLNGITLNDVDAPISLAPHLWALPRRCLRPSAIGSMVDHFETISRRGKKYSMACTLLHALQGWTLMAAEKLAFSSMAAGQQGKGPGLWPQSPPRLVQHLQQAREDAANPIISGAAIVANSRLGEIPRSRPRPGAASLIGALAISPFRWMDNSRPREAGHLDSPAMGHGGIEDLPPRRHPHWNLNPLCLPEKPKGAFSDPLGT